MPAWDGTTMLQQEEEQDWNLYPDTVPRKVTDIPCASIFTIGLGLLGALSLAAFCQGDVNRLHGLADSKGKFCGVDNDVVGKSYLYYCLQKDSYKLDEPSHRVCVRTCERANHNDCPDDQAPPYEVVPFAGVLCRPDGTERHIKFRVRDIFISNPDVIIYLGGIAFSRAWPAIFIPVICCIVMAFLYMSVLQRCTRPVVGGGLLFIVTGSMSFGLYLLHVSKIYGADGIPGTGDAPISKYGGICMNVFALLLLFVTVLWRNNLSASIACLRAGAECIWDMPSMVFEPFMASFWKLSFMGFLASGGLHLISWLQSDGVANGTVEVHMKYSWYNYLFMAFYVFMSVWVMEFGMALSYFAIAFAAQQWFFAPYNKALQTKEAPNYSTCSAYYVALRYHFGTLAYGSLVVMLFRFPRMFLGALSYGFLWSGNEIARCVGYTCSCCLEALECFFKYSTPYAYMDVALSGARFWKAARFSVRAMEHPSVRFFSIHSATWLVQFVGLSIVSATGGAIAYFLCRFSHMFKDMAQTNIESDSYVFAPTVMAACAACMCWVSSMPFLLLSGHVSDNLLFCYAIEKQRLSARPMMAAMESANMFSRLASCATSREQHKAGSTSAHPPVTQNLLEEAKLDAAGCDNDEYDPYSIEAQDPLGRDRRHPGIPKQSAKTQNWF